jgi:[protein-PII] uridylyltransferase
MNQPQTNPPSPVALTELFQRGALEAKLEETPVAIGAYRGLLKWGAEELATAFKAGAAADDLVHGRAALIDVLLAHAWRHFLSEAARALALVAVGGYGRGELHPGSDIDLLILHGERDPTGFEDILRAFITFLWDIGLETRTSVRNRDECLRLARDDISVMTNLLEARRLCGSAALFQCLRGRFQQSDIWPARAYFQAKLEEQHARHEKYRGTAYNLEPNVKESPGGLRDLHTIVWVAKRHFDAQTLHELVGYGFLTEAEHAELLGGRGFLWRVRFAMHMITGRHEDRLLFDYQVRIAQLFGYSDSDANRGVEAFMQAYYRAVKRLSCLNDMLLQLFQEAILYTDDEPPRPINRRFQAQRGFIEARRDDVFRQNPAALLEIFHLLQTHAELRGIRAQTLRLIRRDRECIDARLRDNLRLRARFMAMLRAPRGVTHALGLMNRYGVLGRYLPVFGRIVGLMQYDLFHTLTVDEHILFVVGNLRRLMLAEFDHEMPYFSRLAQSLPKPELLYIAGLFHDIAKGRGGDHSTLGAEEAEAFCAAHGLPSWDTEVVTWLVRQHLLMSMTAQKRDIADPRVIHDFATHVGDRVHLDYLFVLTVCDIRATNPTLWNAWRESLLTQLYQIACRALERGPQNPLEEHELVSESRAAAARLLGDRGIDPARVQTIWARFDDDYFLRNSPEEIAWHATAIASAGEESLPLVLVETLPEHSATVFVYTHDVDYLFGLSTATLAQLGLTILDARIATTRDGYTLDSYVAMEGNGDEIAGPARHREIRAALDGAIRDPRAQPKVSRRTSRRLRHFSLPTQVAFSQDFDNRRSVMELVTRDRPGLLSLVGGFFKRYGILLHAAKIATIGERAEDVFFITDSGGRPLTDEAIQDRLRRLLIRTFDT